MAWGMVGAGMLVAAIVVIASADASAQAARPDACATKKATPPQDMTKCRGKDSAYACPLTEAALLKTGKYCKSAGDGGEFDHKGDCYREVVAQSGNGGQQCCYTRGVDNCTGSYDAASPYVAQKGARYATTQSPNVACDSSQLDRDASCRHCRVDVLPFCADHCKRLVHGFTSSYYEDCSGDVSDRPGMAQGLAGTWSQATCGCGAGVLNSLAAYGCTTQSDYPDALGH